MTMPKRGFMTMFKRWVMIMAALVMLFLVCWGLRWLYTAYYMSQTATILREIGNGVEQYTQDHHDHLPTLGSRTLLAQQLSPYGSEITLSSVHALLQVPGTNIPYLGNFALSDRDVKSIPMNREVVLLYQARPRFGGRWVLLLDDGYTRAKFISEARWQARTSGGKMLNFPNLAASRLS